jgi:hypothetical protein
VDCKSYAKSPALAESGESAAWEDTKWAAGSNAQNCASTWRNGALIFCDRQTLQSVRLVGVAYRLDPTLESSLSLYSSLISREGGAASNPALAAAQIFQSNVMTQSRLPSYIRYLFRSRRSERGRPESNLCAPKECILDCTVSPPIVVKDLGLYSAP